MTTAGRVLVAAAACLMFALQADAATIEVAISNYVFHAVPATAHVGDVIEWVNNDPTEHTATADDGSFNATVAPGKSFRFTLKKLGKLSFHCRYHSYMTGAIQVRP
jgi:plastocyanin